MGREKYFFLAAFLVAAALLKIGVYWVPVVVGIAIAGFGNFLWKRTHRG